ncbi:D-2-hydroxyacid dehydrogenase [Brevibacterium moorei]|uniref:D-2-hydroxyacid dehydrogenase n=1 Tax=Brevibacterium moorei TaxID=2968457 RepID=UPI00211CD340|nr:D-2-hydroxyacid dehydrogenase [Brevibacterium sp. 68QC2CO]MCQ9384100.1 D-2-hydroxyacid dehydrogenase [Brevibacterium sp. 68QC2CO]
MTQTPQKPTPETVLTIVQDPQLQRSPRLAGLSTEVRWAHADNLAALLPGTEVLFIRSPRAARELPELVDTAGGLRWIHTGSAGVDHLGDPRIAALGAAVTNARGVFDEPMAEWVLSHLFAHVKEHARFARQQAAHEWAYRPTGMLAGTSALIVGVGSIGRAIARALRAVGVSCSGAGTHARAGDAEFETIVDSARLAEHVGAYDWIIDIAPLTGATRGLIDSRVLEACAPHAVLVNLGRGASVVTDDLVGALEAGTIAGAILDVTDPEPLPADHPLWDAPGVVITPHMSGDLRDSEERVNDQFIENWERFQTGGELLNPVDVARGYARA